MSRITVETAQYYLRIDELPQGGDDELQAFIDAAEAFIERKTGHILTPKTKTYRAEPDGCIRVYDYPINSSLTAYTTYLHPGYLLIEGEESVTLNVGYTDPADVPQALLSAAKQMLKVFYYESETQQNTSLVPMPVKQIIDNYKRFVI